MRPWWKCAYCWRRALATGGLALVVPTYADVEHARREHGI